MQLTRKLRLLLVLSGLTATAIGTALLLAPTQFYASNGIALAADPNVLSEARAPGGALLAVGLLMLVGAFARAVAPAATIAGALVYLAYGSARVLSMALDGMPGTGLVAATAIELVMGALCAAAIVRAARHAPRRAVEVA